MVQKLRPAEKIILIGASAFADMTQTAIFNLIKHNNTHFNRLTHTFIHVSVIIHNWHRIVDKKPEKTSIFKIPL